MESKIDSNNILNSSCKNGKELSICAKIIDTEKAIEFLSTMYYNQEDNQFGLVVYSWGHFDEVKAMSNRENLRSSLEEKHRMEMDLLMNRSLISFIEEQ